MAREENEFLRTRGFAEYAALYLGINEEQPEDTKGRHEFPSEISKMSSVLSAESRAGQYQHFGVENAAAHLHGMIDGADRDQSSLSLLRESEPRAGRDIRRIEVGAGALDCSCFRTVTSLGGR